MNRRQCLTALGASVVLKLPAFADSVQRPEFSFLIVTDTHIGRQDSMAPATRWTQTVRALDAAAGDFVLHLGDVVDGQREAQYAVYKDIRRGLRKPIHEIPGNHDQADHFEKHIRESIDMVLDHKGVRFLLVNNSHTDSHDGFLTGRQLTWIGERCDEAAKRGLFLMLCMHVPVHENRHPDRGWYVKPKDGQTELYAILNRHRDRVLALLHGHFHNGVRGWNDHTPYHEILFPSALYNQDRNFAKTKPPGYFLEELRPGYVAVTLQAGRMTLRYHPVGVAANAAEQRCELPQLKW